MASSRRNMSQVQSGLCNEVLRKILLIKPEWGYVLDAILGHCHYLGWRLFDTTNADEIGEQLFYDLFGEALL